MTVFLKRILAGLLACLAAGAWASVPLLQLSAADNRMNLLESMSSLRMDVRAAIDPQELWQGTAGAPVQAQPRWKLAAGERMVGRITLHGGRESDIYVVEVAAPSVDEVRVWHREAGGQWHAAIAGDRVPLSRWPFVAQYPGFPIQLRDAPVDLIVAATNSGPLQVAVSLVPDAGFREGQTRSANLSGMILGLGAMVAVVCALGALTTRRRASWLLVGVCVWTLTTAAALNGYMAVWFTPEAADFNDSFKHFTAMLLAGLMVVLTAESLDDRYLRRPERLASWGVLLACLAWAMAQAFWLPLSWRVYGAVTVALITIA